MNRKVSFPGHGVFWFLDDGDGHGPLAPLEHCDADGDILNWDIALQENGYAQVCRDGKIRRYHEVVGTIHDLTDVVYEW